MPRNTGNNRAQRDGAGAASMRPRRDAAEYNYAQ